MNILLLGSGGREHAIAASLKKSTQCSHLFIAPGNAGTALLGTNVALSLSNFEAIGQFALQNDIRMVVVGPEQPLVDGIADYFAADPKLKEIMMIGPSKEAAQLEGSKDFAKAFMQRNNIPTAAYATFTASQLDEAYQFLETLNAPYVLKADGLAAGKGVVILDNLEDAKLELKAMLVDSKFGNASSKVVIEQFLSGIELSVFALVDGKHYKILPEAKDYKRIGEGDTGLNTGGMGSISPVPFADKAFMQKVEKQIVAPTVKALSKEKLHYCGFLFFGLMNCNGDPYVIEYNVRMGDPETQSVMPRIKSDLVSLLEKTATGTLNTATIDVDPHFAATVMMVAKGYPEKYEKGKVMTLPELPDPKRQYLFHSGTALNDKKQTVTNGGRVIAATSLATTLPEALLHSFQNADLVTYDGKYFRHDIGQDLLKLML